MSLNLDDLEIHEENFCEGQSGVIKLAKIKSSGKPIVLKLIPVILNAQARQTVVDQLQTLYASEHSNITKFHGVAYSENASAITLGLEYCEVGSLMDVYTKHGPIPEDKLGLITAKVLDGLVYLHKTRHLIHRDIKPSNILLTLAGEVKLTDFGLSAQLVNTLDKKQTYVGAVTYMSPERISGLSYSFQSDVWSLGIALAECAMGVYPYQTESKMELYDLLDVIVDSPAPSLPNDKFSQSFCDFIALCLRKRQEERPGAEDLLGHPFIVAYRDANIADWCKKVRCR